MATNSSQLELTYSEHQAIGSAREHSGAWRVELTDQERAAVGCMAEELSQVPPALVDDLGWIAAARQHGCQLPVRLAQALRHFRSDAGQSGTILITNLPVDAEGLPDTPSVPDSVERRATVPAAVAMLLGQQLGDIFAFRDEKQGALVQNVVPVPALACSQSNGGSVPLELHNENAFHPHRPDLIGLMCLRSDHEKKAGTLVSSIRQALAVLDAADVSILKAPRFVTMAPPSFRTRGTTGRHCVLDGAAHDPNIRVDFSATTAPDEEARDALKRLGEALMRVSTSLVLQPGEMAFLDNRLVLHGRTQFTPRYDGRDRWLHRVYVHLDGRRSLSHRVGTAPILA